MQETWPSNSTMGAVQQYDNYTSDVWTGLNSIIEESSENIGDRIAYVMKWVRLSFIPFAVFGNLLVILSIAIYRRLHTIPNLFIASLAVTDFLVGAMFLPMLTLTIPYGDSIYMNKWFCLTINGPYYATLHIQLQSLIAVALDRFIAISYPFHYQTFATWTNAVLLLIFIYVSPIIGAVCFMTFWNKYVSLIVNT